MFFKFKKRVEIGSLPKREFQRNYIDEFFASKVPYLIRGRKVINASYGHCGDYPKGFWIEFE